MMRIWKYLVVVALMGSCQSKAPSVKPSDPPRTFSVGDKHIVKSVDFSPDGKVLITGGENKKIKLINRETGEVVWTSPEQPDAVLATAISADGKYFASTCGDNEKNSAQVVVFSMTTKTELWGRKGLTNDVQLVRFTANGKILGVANHFNITLFETETGKQIKFFSGHMPDVVAPYGHVDAVTQICFMKDSMKFVSVGWDKNVKIWDVGVGHEVRTFPEAERINACILNPDETKIITGSSDAIHVWNPGSNRADTIVAYSGEITAMCPVRDGRYFVTGDDKGTLALWDMATYAKLNEIKKAHVLGVWCLNTAPDGKYFVSSGGNGDVTIWDVDYFMNYHTPQDSTKIKT
jgi:WD40 repeat protein